MWRKRQRRLSASDNSRVLFEVSTTLGRVAAVMVPNSGIETWKSDSTSSNSASVSTSTRSTSSINSTTGRLRPDRLEQGALQKEVLREDVVLELAPVVLLVCLDAEQLLLVVPLVERLGLVEPLVALEADETPRPGPGQATWPARSCPRRRGPRPGSASPACRPGTPPGRCGRRPDSRLRPTCARTAAGPSIVGDQIRTCPSPRTT